MFKIGDEVIVFSGDFSGTKGIVTRVTCSQFSENKLVRIKIIALVYPGLDYRSQTHLNFYDYKLELAKKKKIRRVTAWK